MPSPAFGSFLRAFSDRTLRKQEQEANIEREDFLNTQEILLRAREDPSLTDVGKVHVSGMLRDLYGKSSKGKLKKFDRVGFGEKLAQLGEPQIEEQRTEAGQAPSVSQQIPGDEQEIAQLIHGMGLGLGQSTGMEPTSGERGITAAPGGGELVSEAQNPFMRSREDMLGEGIEMKLRTIQEYVDQGLLSPDAIQNLLPQIITGMQQPRPAAQAAPNYGEEYNPETNTFIRVVKRPGQLTKPGPREPVEKETDLTDIQAHQDRQLKFYQEQMGMDYPEAFRMAQRDTIQFEEDERGSQQAIREGRKLVNQARRDAAAGGKEKDRSTLAFATLRYAQSSAANRLKQRLEMMKSNPDTADEAYAIEESPQLFEAEMADEISKALGSMGVDETTFGTLIGDVLKRAAAPLEAENYLGQFENE